MAELAQTVKDRRRAAQPPKRTPDPYWSLWGRIKAAWRREQQFDDDYEAAEGDNLYEQFVIEEYERDQSGRSPCLLPRRQIPIYGSPDHLSWTGPDGRQRSKNIKNDQHAVNTLRKLDTDDTYWEDHP